MTTLGDMLGKNDEENFTDFDLTEIQDVLSNLKGTDAIDIAHAEMLQKQTLRCADILSEYLGKLVKTVSYLESKINAAKNKASLEYTQTGTGKITADVRRQAGECAPGVNELTDRLARAKGAKEMLMKKYDIIIKSHHSYKEVAMGMRKGMISSPNPNAVEGYE